MTAPPRRAEDVLAEAERRFESMCDQRAELRHKCPTLIAAHDAVHIVRQARAALGVRTTDAAEDVLAEVRALADEWADADGGLNDDPARMDTLNYVGRRLTALLDAVGGGSDG